MGEMADMYNDYQEGTVWNAYDYLSGNISDVEAYDLGVLDITGNFDAPQWIVDLACADGLSTSDDIQEELNRYLQSGYVKVPIIYTRRVSQLDYKGMSIYNNMLDRLTKGRTLSNKQRLWIDQYCKYGWEVLERGYRNHAKYNEYLTSAYKNIAAIIEDGDIPTDKQRKLVDDSYYGGWEWFCLDIPFWCNNDLEETTC